MDLPCNMVGTRNMVVGKFTGNAVNGLYIRMWCWVGVQNGYLDMTTRIRYGFTGNAVHRLYITYSCPGTHTLTGYLEGLQEMLFIVCT